VLTESDYAGNDANHNENHAADFDCGHQHFGQMHRRRNITHQAQRGPGGVCTVPGFERTASLSTVVPLGSREVLLSVLDTRPFGPAVCAITITRYERRGENAAKAQSGSP